MKKTMLILGLVALIASCGGNDKSEPAAKTEAPKTERKLTPEEDRGETLIAQNDCLGCHKIDQRLNGPSYREVAEKYAGQAGIADTLAQHIIKGHVGTWGDIAMTPHQNLSEADAKAMVAYILSLKQ
ncbi:MAG TPA: c-type cytochrome [Flavisolibacter sp.]|nr:c-type cytochrome [Flavisolibacter sp.]